MAYTRVNWQDSPSTATPISASNLNKMDKGIKDLEEDLGTLSSSLATVATTGDYDDLTDTPNLATVATSGSYNDLTNKPQEHLVNIGTSVDSSYNTNLIHSDNLLRLVDLLRYASDRTFAIVSDSEINCTSTSSSPISACNGEITGKLEAGTYTFKNYGTLNCFVKTSASDYSHEIATNGTYTFTYDGSSYLALQYANIQAGGTATFKAQINVGSTALDYSVPMQNKIVVNDTKFTETIGVGTSVNSANRVNVLKSKNLYNLGTDIANTVIGSDGALVSATGYTCSQLIPVAHDSQYTVSYVNTSASENIIRIGFYKSDGTPISRTTISTNYTITTPANCYYIRVAYLTQTNHSIQVEEGTSSSTYVPFNRSIVVDNEEIYSKGVVLYNNLTGSNGSITLNDNVSNYRYLEIFYDTGSTASKVVSTKVDLSLSSNTSLYKWWCDSGGSAYCAIKDITISGNTITTYGSGIPYSVISYTSSLSKANQNQIYIFKVLGYK